MSAKQFLLMPVFLLSVVALSGCGATGQMGHVQANDNSADAEPAKTVLTPLASVGAHLNTAIAAFLDGKSSQEAFRPWGTDPKSPDDEIRTKLREFGAVSAHNMGFEYEFIFRKDGKPVYYLRAYVLTDGKRVELMGFDGEPVKRELFVTGLPLRDFSDHAAPFHEAAKALLDAVKKGQHKALPIADGKWWSQKLGLPAKLSRDVVGRSEEAQRRHSKTCGDVMALDYDEVDLRLDDQVFLVRDISGKTVAVLRGTLGLTRDNNVGFRLERVIPVPE